MVLKKYSVAKLELSDEDAPDWLKKEPKSIEAEEPVETNEDTKGE